MEAETGFSYSLSSTELEKIYNYLKIRNCDVSSKGHFCRFGCLKKSFIERYTDKVLSEYEKIETIKFMFEQLELLNKKRLEYRLILRELNIVRKQ